MEHVEILRHESKKYFYLWNTRTGAQVCDLDGNPYRFETHTQAQDFIAQGANYD